VASEVASPLQPSGVASLGRVVAYSSGRVAASPSLGRASIEALSGHVAASSFGLASAGLALASGAVSLSALASSEGRGRGGGVVGHRRRHRRPGGVGGRPHRRRGAGDRAPGEATSIVQQHQARDFLYNATNSPQARSAPAML
jgi:hypothetical protein